MQDRGGGKEKTFQNGPMGLGDKVLKRSTAIGALLAVALLSPAASSAGPDDVHSENIKQLVNVPIKAGGGAEADGSDMAFQKNLLVAGSYSGTAFYKILNGAPYVRQVGFHTCPGGQGDVSVYKNLVFVSIGSAQSEEAIGCADAKESIGKAGIRILDISDVTRPEQIGFVETDCGSHTHTIVPKKDAVYIYNESYPLGVQTETCSVVSHRKVSIIKVPLDDPAEAKVETFLDVSPQIGCHDVTIYDNAKMAAAACIGETQLWNIEDPLHPEVVSRIFNPGISIHHGTGVTWDNKYLVIADEFAGSVTGQCLGSQASPLGAMWFYDIQDPTLPVLAGYYNVPRRGDPESVDEVSYIACTTHNFHVLPMKDPKKYIVVAGYRASGWSVVDFSDPSAPEEIGHYLQMNGGLIPDVWAAYWYNGRIYANDNGAGQGVSVFEMKGLTTKEVRSFGDRLNPQVQAL
jgi:hypothetical protein